MDFNHFHSNNIVFQIILTMRRREGIMYYVNICLDIVNCSVAWWLIRGGLKSRQQQKLRSLQWIMRFWQVNKALRVHRATPVQSHRLGRLPVTFNRRSVNVKLLSEDIQRRYFLQKSFISMDVSRCFQILPILVVFPIHKADLPNNVQRVLVSTLLQGMSSKAAPQCIRTLTLVLLQMQDQMYRMAENVINKLSQVKQKIFIRTYHNYDSFLVKFAIILILLIYFSTDIWYKSSSTTCSRLLIEFDHTARNFFLFYKG